MLRLKRQPFVFDESCACGKICVNTDLHLINGCNFNNIKLCSLCFNNFCCGSCSKVKSKCACYVSSYNIDVIPISASSYFEIHCNDSVWCPPPLLKKDDMVRLCCEDIEEFGELFWCVVTSNNIDGSCFVKITNYLKGPYKQKYGDVIPIPIYPEHVFDYLIK